MFVKKLCSILLEKNYFFACLVNFAVKKGEDMSDLIYKEESYKIMGACFNVYKDKGCGFLEAVYQECLEIEFPFQKIPAVSQKQLQLYYRGIELKQKYIPDFVCYDKIILKIKAVNKVTEEHFAQVFNYLYATGYKLGILVNFAHYPKLHYERIVLSKSKHIDCKTYETREKLT